MAHSAESVSNTQRLLDVPLLMAAPLALPSLWVAGAVLVAVRRPRGWIATLAMCPFGLFAPLYLFTLGGITGTIAGSASLLACLSATWRLMNR